MTDFRGWAWFRALNWRSTSDDMVTVWPNITWPDVGGDIGPRIDRLGQAGSSGGETARSVLAVSVELQVGDVQAGVAGGIHGRQRGFGVARHAEVAAMQVKRMRQAQCLGCRLQGVDDGAGGDLAVRHGVVEAEAAGVGLERSGGARIDRLDPDRSAARQHARRVVGDRRWAFLVGHQAQQVVVVAEHGQDRGVDDRNVGQFQVGLRGDVGGDRGLHDHGVAHGSVEAADELGDRHRGRSAAGTQVRQQQAGGVDVGAGDMGMDVDAAGHDDAAGQVQGLVGAGVIGGGDHAAVLHPKVADVVARVGGIDDPATCEACQHDGNAAVIAATVSATLGMAAGAEAAAKAIRAQRGIEQHGVVVAPGAADLELYRRPGAENGRGRNQSDRRHGVVPGRRGGRECGYPDRRIRLAAGDQTSCVEAPGVVQRLSAGETGPDGEAGQPGRGLRDALGAVRRSRAAVRRTGSSC